MEKRFTLIEIVVTIVVLAILLSIVGIKVSDFKNSAVNAAVNTNVSILQTSVDTYKLKNNSYPVKNKISLTSPQLIDVKELVDGGYLKKDLDLKKINSQYYWVDVFGRVWGSTENVLEKYTVVDTDSTKTLNFDLPKKVEGYNIYEVSGYNEKEIANLDVGKLKKATSNVASAASGPNSKYIRLVKSVTSSDGSAISYEVPNHAKTYLVSTIDQYGLESAPVGEKGNSNFTPLINFEGTTEFEITGQQVMKWIRFYSIGDTPGESKIEFEFKVKDSNGNYKEYQKDFDSLENSTGITVKIIMTGDSAGNKPSIYDMRVIYTLDGQKSYEKIIPDLPMVYHPDEPNDIPDNIGKLIDDRVLTEKRPSEGGEGKDPIELDPEEKEDVIVGEKAAKVCPAGFRYTNINAEGNILDDSKRAYISYLISLKEGKKLSSIEKPVLSDNLKILSTHISYNKDGRYNDAKTVSEVPSGSCVNIYFTIEKEGTGSVGVIKPPVIIVVDGEDEIIVEEPAKPKKDIEAPFIDEEPALGEEWTTVSTLRFVGSSNSGEPTKWIGFEAEDTQPENTQIVYEFSALVNNTWTPVTRSVSNLQSSAYALVIAKLQVRTENLGKQGQELPTVTKVSLISEDGNYELPPYKPMVIITPSKDNNEGKNLYSTKSKISWDVFTFDQHGKEIVDIEWENKQETYGEAGYYKVKARVQNEDGIWSNWSTYSFHVVDEEPVARLKNHLAYIRVGESINWNNVMFDNSYDPDGDGIIERQWDGNIKETYTVSDVGTISLRLRVKDAEGYWSPWVEDTAVVYNDQLFTNVNPDTYDKDLKTSELVETRRNIGWLENLTSNRVVITYNSEGNSDSAGGHFLVFDKDGQQMTFRNAKTNKMVNQLDYDTGAKNKTIEFIVPEGAEYIQLVAYTKFSLTEISAGTDRILPSKLKDVSTTPSPFSVTINWEKEQDVAKVLVYRNGEYVGESTTNSFVDTPLTSLTTYSYTLESLNANGHRTGYETFSEKTTRPVVLFKSESGAELDRDPKTMATYLTTEYLITWDVLEGDDVPADLENKVVQLNASFKTGSASYKISIIDKNGNHIPFVYYRTNNYNESFATIRKIEEAGLLNFDYPILMPKGAHAIKLYSEKPTPLPQEIYVKDVFDLDAVSKSNDLTNVKGESTPTSIKLTWEADNTVKQIFVYRNGEYITQLDGSVREYTDPILSVDTEYEYSFKMYDQYRNVTSMKETFKFKTLDRDFTFYDNLNTVSTSAWYDEDSIIITKRTSSSAIIPEEGMLIKWKIKEGSGINSINGKEVRSDVIPSSNSKARIILTFVDENGISIPFEYKSNYINDRFEKVESVEMVYSSTVPTRAFIVPEGAVGIEIMPKDAGTTVETNSTHFIVTNAYEFPDKLENVKAETTENAVNLSWSQSKNVIGVEIYRDGEYIGTTSKNANTYSDKAIPSNKEYTYTLIERTKENNRIFENNIIVAKTKLPDVYFTSNVEEYTLAKWVDKTLSGFTPSNEKVIDFEWNIKEGVNISKDDLVGRSIVLTTSSNGTDATLPTINFLDENEHPLTFWYAEGTNRYTETTGFTAGSSARTYYLQIPEGAKKLRLNQPENVINRNILLGSIYFADYTSNFSFEVSNVIPDINKVLLNYTKENVKMIYIFANNVNISQNTGVSYQHTGLKPETENKYYFMIVDSAHNMKFVNYDNPIVTKTLAKEWKWISDDFTELEVESIDDGLLNNVAKVEGSAEVSWILREDIEANKDARYNKLVVTSSVSNATTKFKVEFLDENNNILKFTTYEIGRAEGDYLHESSYILEGTSRSSNNLFFPEGASKIKFTRIQGSGYLNLQELINNNYKEFLDPLKANMNHSTTTGSIIFTGNSKEYQSAQIFINGERLSLTNTTTYDKVIQGEKLSYNYLLIGKGGYSVYYKEELIDVEIPEEDIVFYSEEGIRAGKFFSNSSSNLTIPVKEMTVAWRVKDGANINSNLENRLIQIQTGADTQFVVEVLDSNNNVIPTLYSSGTINKFNYSSNTTLSSSTTRFVVPENASKFRIRNVNGVERSLRLDNVNFIDEVSKQIEVPTVNYNVNKTSISFDYSIPKTQDLIVTLEGDAGYTQTKIIPYTRKNINVENLFMNKEFRMRISLIEGGNHIILEDTIIKTKSNSAVLTANLPLETTSVMFSESTDNVKLVNENFEVNWEDVNGQNVDIAGKTMLFRGSISNSTYPYVIYFKDSNGNNLDVSYKINNNSTIITEKSVTVSIQPIKTIYMTVPENAVKMMVVSEKDHNSSIINVYEISVID